MLLLFRRLLVASLEVSPPARQISLLSPVTLQRRWCCSGSAIASLGGRPTSLRHAVTASSVYLTRSRYAQPLFWTQEEEIDVSHSVCLGRRIRREKPREVKSPTAWLCFAANSREKGVREGSVQSTSRSLGANCWLQMMFRIRSASPRDVEYVPGWQCKGWACGGGRDLLLTGCRER